MNKTHAAIFAVFAIEAAAAAVQADHLLAAPGWLWVLASLAALRIARTVTYNEIGEPLRRAFTVTEPDGSGAGDTVNPRPGHPLGSLFACPICTGTHAAMILVLLYAWLPSVGTVAIIALGLAGGAEVFNWISEAAEWHGLVSREQTGAYVRTREAGTQPVELDRLDEIVKEWK